MNNFGKMTAILRYTGAVFSLVVGLGLLGSFSTTFAATITAGPTGNGVYAVVGSGLTGVGGMDVTVTYDTSTLGNPRVAKGVQLGNALFVVNPNQPGVIRIGIVSTSGISSNNVTIATITFDRKGDSSGLLTGLTATMISTSGAPLAVTPSYSNAPTTDASQVVKTETPPSDSPPSSPPGGGVSPGSSTTSPSGGGVYLGTVSMPGDDATSQPEKTTETQKVDQQPLPSQEAATGETHDTVKAEPEEKKAPIAKKDIVYQAVSEKIRTSSEKLTMEKLLALFELPKELPYAQTPRVVLSDGKASVRLTVRLGGDSKETPSFALKQAKLLSLQQGEGGEWLIEALPVVNTNEASLTVSLEASSILIPLTVAQPINDRSLGDLKGLSEKTFPLFLKERGTKEAPRYDLNGDGTRDYLDDYIFAANFLAGGGQAPLPDKRPAPAAPARHKQP